MVVSRASQCFQCQGTAASTGQACVGSPCFILAPKFIIHTPAVLHCADVSCACKVAMVRQRSGALGSSAPAFSSESWPLGPQYLQPPQQLQQHGGWVSAAAALPPLQFNPLPGGGAYQQVRLEHADMQVKFGVLRAVFTCVTCGLCHCCPPAMLQHSACSHIRTCLLPTLPRSMRVGSCDHP